MIIASNKDRDLAIKALNGLNSQSKEQILEAVNITNALLHSLINSAAIYGDLQVAKAAQNRGNYNKAFLEIGSNRSTFSIGSVNGDIITTIKEFCINSDPGFIIYDETRDEEEEEDDEYDDDDSNEDEEESDPF